VPEYIITLILQTREIEPEELTLMLEEIEKYVGLDEDISTFKHSHREKIPDAQSGLPF
jgi:hypothetical protein